MADVGEIEVVVAHHERATLRVGDVFLKIDADQTRTDVEVEAMALAPIPTLGHEEHLGDVVAGYGTDVDLDVVRGWWSLRSLLAIRWLVEHGYGAPEEFPEVAVLRSRP